jgi:hypothetical protein
MMPDKTFFRKFLERFQFPLEPCGYLFIDAGLGRKQTDHDMFIRSFPNGPAEKAGVAFMKDINDAVIVDVGSPFSYFTPA